MQKIQFPIPVNDWIGVSQTRFQDIGLIRNDNTKLNRMHSNLID